MDAVALDRSRNVDQILIEHGHNRDVVLRRETAKDFIERANVVASIIRRKRDAGEQDLYMSFLQGREHLIEIGARLVDGQAAQAVVAAKLHDHNGRVQAQHIGQAGERIFGGCAARALVDHFVRVAARIEQLLQVFGIGLAIGKA